MKNSLNLTEKKLALLFSGTVSVLVFVTAILVLFFLQLSIENSAKRSLKNTLTSLETEFEEDSQLKEKKIELQSSNLNDSIDEESEAGYDSSSREYFALPNIYQDNIRTNTLEESKQVVVNKDADLSSLESNQAVYSRVILPNGDILFTSDLFEQNTIDHKEKGFQKISYKENCIYAYNGKINEGDNKGAVVQVALYCPLTRTQNRNIIITAILATLCISALSYVIGFSVAKKLLKPVKESAEQTLTFTRNVYHELLTPLTVALSTAQTKLKTGKYKEGLESVKEDLENATSSLDLLKAKLMQHDAKLTFKEINISEILNEVLVNYKSKILEKNIEIDYQSEKISMQADKVIVKLIFKNLVDNAIKYCPSNSKISIELNEKYFRVQNAISKKTDRKNSNGIGLRLVNDMCNILNWEFTHQTEESLFKSIILF